MSHNKQTRILKSFDYTKIIPTPIPTSSLSRQRRPRVISNRQALEQLVDKDRTAQNLRNRHQLLRKILQNMQTQSSSGLPQQPSRKSRHSQSVPLQAIRLIEAYLFMRLPLNFNFQSRIYKQVCRSIYYKAQISPRDDWMILQTEIRLQDKRQLEIFQDGCKYTFCFEQVWKALSPKTKHYGRYIGEFYQAVRDHDSHYSIILGTPKQKAMVLGLHSLLYSNHKNYCFSQNNKSRLNSLSRAEGFDLDTLSLFEDASRFNLALVTVEHRSMLVFGNKEASKVEGFPGLSLRHDQQGWHLIVSDGISVWEKNDCPVPRRDTIYMAENNGECSVFSCQQDRLVPVEEGRCY